MVEAKAAMAAAEGYAELSASDLDDVYALHLAATAAVGRPDLIKPESHDFFRGILEGGGRITGFFQDGRLVGYGVLQTELPPSEDARPLIGLSAGDSLAKLAGAGVLPEAWGAGIHDALIDIRVEQARRAGIGHLYATAAPGNARSWANLVDAGFSVRLLFEKYGGHLRYLLHRDLGRPAAPAGEGVWCAAGDTQRQRELLDAGLTGLRWRRGGDGARELFYGRPA
jgi:ribosomal protein S18 acetylase RimI-like enzyme